MISDAAVSAFMEAFGRRGLSGDDDVRHCLQAAIDAQDSGQDTETFARRVDADMLALSAIRYCMGRSSYIVARGVAWARRFGASSAFVRRNVIDDIEVAIQRGARGVEWNTLGEEAFAREWKAVLAELKALPGNGGTGT